MAFIITDGQSGRTATVSVENRLNNSSKSNPRTFYVSRDDGLTFTLASVDSSAAAGDLIAYLKNDSTTRNVYIKEIQVSALNAALWKVFEVTGTAAGSSAITPSNINLASGQTADATARGDGALTGLTTADLIRSTRTTAGDAMNIVFDDALILGPSDAIAVEYDTGTTGAAEVNIMLHFEDIGVV